ncbi:hypothetical protein B0A50_05007 [Salinomyces thailandicus]|uniref:Oxidase ustYa n=1 Tax=Salinomyces thailandicus TaxID=706561 RepID=A0A4U0U027_9PEZI|nr:hypothetical protein B0A50_05007 [Salinomyces thailandica]
MEDEQLIKESEDFGTQFRALSDSHRRLKRYVTILSVALAFAVIALLGLVGNNTWNQNSDTGILSPVPSIQKTRVTFEENKRFAAGSSSESDEAWAALTPQGDGFILLANNTRQQWDLQPGKPTSEGEVYDISLFHELHCLRHIRTHTFTLQAMLGKENWQEIYDLLLKPGEDHVFHCFDYIRQALMCAGDMTVEWPRVEADGSRFAVDGWGITHECKSWDAIMQYMQEHTISNVF